MKAQRLVIDSSVWIAAPISPTGTATGISRVADDDEFLALAVTGRADAIISGDSDLLELAAHERIPVLTPAQFLRQLRSW